VKGRGRLGRRWHTPPRTALIVSVILRPKPEYLSQITMLGALAICDMLERLSLPSYPATVNTWDVGIKWPNDVHLNGKKVSGVLSEAVWEGQELQGVVLGMGVNVRIDFSDTELADSATSIETVLGKRVERLDLLAELLAQVDSWYERLGEAFLFDSWKGRLNMLGKRVKLQDGVAGGVAESVDESGALLVRGADHQLHRLTAGDITLGD
jgi:BirA family transcriptional regulator, biotin operon repressor / biotin---[acetyl-CoA-carboxylase] ligase